MILSTKRLWVKSKHGRDDDYKPEEAILYDMRKYLYLIQDVTGTLNDDEMPWPENERPKELENV